MNSRIYKGWVRHRRAAPVRHQFRYRMFMLYIDLAELPRIFAGTPFWSARRRAFAWFKRSDYLGRPDVPLDTAVRDLVQERTGVRPGGPIRLLTHLRYFGYCMNPVSFYYCFNESGESLENIVAEITNTPWKERHQYVLRVAGATAPGATAPDTSTPGAPSKIKRFDFAKDFHVSPFLPMDMQYRWLFREPGERLFVNMQNFRDGVPVFDATLALRQEPISSRALLGVLAAFPLMTVKVIAAIHWQALRLWLKGTPVHTHPDASRPATASGASTSIS